VSTTALPHPPRELADRDGCERAGRHRRPEARVQGAHGRARILFPYNNISIRKLRENRAPKARREKQAARLVLTSRAAMLMGEGKKAALVLHYICPIMEFV